MQPEMLPVLAVSTNTKHTCAMDACELAATALTVALQASIPSRLAGS